MSFATALGAAAAVVGLVVGVVSFPSYWPTFAAWCHGQPSPAAAGDPKLRIAGGDNNGGGVFLRNSPVLTYGEQPELRGGNGGQYGPGGPVSLDNSPVVVMPAPPRPPQ